jgi:hypothetical protein
MYGPVGRRSILGSNLSPIRGTGWLDPDGGLCFCRKKQGTDLRLGFSVAYPPPAQRRITHRARRNHPQLKPTRAWGASKEKQASGHGFLLVFVGVREPQP